MTTDLEYYSDESLHGDYQYVYLKEIVENMELEAIGNDSYLKHVSRHNLIRYAKNAIRNVVKSAANEILAFEITVPTNLVVTMPQDFVDYVRVSAVERDPTSGGYHLKPLDVNYNISTAIGYLQDNDANILFDENGYVLTADSSNGYSVPFKKYTITPLCAPTRESSNIKNFSKNGQFTIDQRRGKILFGSEFSECDVVIEYISDGLQFDDSKIKVHKNLQNCIEDSVYYSGIERLRNVPANEKQRALMQYKASLHQAKIDMADIKIERLYKVI